WRCLSYVTERHGAKSLMFACITCLCLTALLTTATLYVSVAENARALEDGWPGWDRLEFRPFTTLAQITSAVFIVLNVLLFSCFLPAMPECFRNELWARRVAWSIPFTGFLVGGTLSLLLGQRQLTDQPGFQAAMAGCWLLYFLYHLGLVASARNCIQANRHKL